MRYIIIFISSLLLIFAIAPLAASTQHEVCERVVQTALEQAGQVCTGTGRNQVCYGHKNLEAQPQSRFEPFRFHEAGDIINVTQLKTLRLSPMDIATGSWGVAMMKLQANLAEDKPTQNVTLVLFGDVEIDNAIAAPTETGITISSWGNANVRREPSEQGYVLGTLSPGRVVTAIGRTADSSWLYIDVPDFGERGWISRQLIEASDELDGLNIINPALAAYGPMQAFYLRTGDDSSTCEEAPNDGLLIQTPEGAGEVRLWINEVKIRLGSTVYIQARPNQQMTISTLEGAAHVEAYGIEQTASAGMTVSIPLDSDSKAAAPPNPPARYVEKDISGLPVDKLEEQITVVPPASPAPTNTEMPPTSTETPTNTSMPTNTATQVPTNTPTNTSVPTVETATDIPTQTASQAPTESPTQPASDTSPTSTEEATQETSGSNGSTSQTPAPTNELREVTQSTREVTPEH